MNKPIIASALLTFSLFVSLASAENIKLPEDKPLVAVDVPKSWKPETIENGIVIESPDQVVTLYLEVTPGKATEDLLNENLDYLKKEQHVTVDKDSLKSAEVKISGETWFRASLDGKSKEFGPANIGFLLLKLADHKVLTITYWISKKDFAKDGEALDRILESIKPLK